MEVIKNIATNFGGGDQKAETYRHIVVVLVKSYRAMGCDMSL
jgi:hypothetical protein